MPPPTAEQRCEQLQRELTEIKLLMIDKDDAMKAIVGQRDRAEAKVRELTAEVARLKDGRLTKGEFNALCHNLHQQDGPGIPLQRCEFEEACRKFTDELFNTSPAVTTD